MPRSARNGRKRGALGPGDYFGEIALLRSSLIERSRRTATVTATEPLRCFHLGACQFDAVLYEEDVAVKILREVVKRLDVPDDALIGPVTAPETTLAAMLDAYQARTPPR